MCFFLAFFSLPAAAERKHKPYNTSLYFYFFDKNTSLYFNQQRKMEFELNKAFYPAS